MGVIPDPETFIFELEAVDRFMILGTFARYIIRMCDSVLSPMSAGILFRYSFKIVQIFRTSRTMIVNTDIITSTK